MNKRVPGARSEFYGDVEIRFDAKGWIDEIVLMKNDKCVFHLEYMSGGEIYLGVDELQVWLYAANTIRAQYNASRYG